MNDGLAVLAAWIMFAALLITLLTIVLRRGGGSR